MALVSMTGMLQKARKNAYAVGAFNILDDLIKRFNLSAFRRFGLPAVIFHYRLANLFYPCKDRIDCKPCQRLDIINLSGQVIESRVNISGTTVIDLGAFRRGIYLARIFRADGSSDAAIFSVE